MYYLLAKILILSKLKQFKSTGQGFLLKTYNNVCHLSALTKSEAECKNTPSLCSVLFILAYLLMFLINSLQNIFLPPSQSELFSATCDRDISWYKTCLETNKKKPLFHPHCFSVWEQREHSVT